MRRMAVGNRIDDAPPATGIGAAPEPGQGAFALLNALGGAGPLSLPAPRRTAPPPATNEHVRKSMQGNKRANTKPELLVRERLRAAGLSGYRLHWKVPGHPDVAWPGKKVALFINGCFWHRCPRCKPRMPKSNVEYWVVKFQRNVERDERSAAALEPWDGKSTSSGVPAQEEGGGRHVRRAFARARQELARSCGGRAERLACGACGRAPLAARAALLAFAAGRHLRRLPRGRL